MEGNIANVLYILNTLMLYVYSKSELSCCIQQIHTILEWLSWLLDIMYSLYTEGPIVCLNQETMIFFLSSICLFSLIGIQTI